VASPALAARSAPLRARESSSGCDPKDRLQKVGELDGPLAPSGQRVRL
jgi:hypothetical protein